MVRLDYSRVIFTINDLFQTDGMAFQGSKLVISNLSLLTYHQLILLQFVCEFVSKCSMTKFNAAHHKTGDDYTYFGIIDMNKRWLVYTY